MRIYAKIVREEDYFVYRKAANQSGTE